MYESRITLHISHSRSLSSDALELVLGDLECHIERTGDIVCVLRSVEKGAAVRDQTLELAELIRGAGSSVVQPRKDARLNNLSDFLSASLSHLSVYHNGSYV